MAKFCVRCGNKAGFWSRETFEDGICLCGKCKPSVPTYIKTHEDYRTYEEYQKLEEYIKYSNEVLKPKFQETAKYESFHLDEVNRLFYIETFSFKDALILEVSNVDMFSLDFEEKEASDGLLGGKVRGDVTSLVTMSQPIFCYNDKQQRDVSVRAKSNFLRTKFTYEPPKKMQEFLIRFLTVMEEIREEREQVENQVVEATREVEKAKTLFMIDSLSGMSVEDIKEQRERMISMFQSNAGSEADTKYAQKINNAYEILIKELTK